MEIPFLNAQVVMESHRWDIAVRSWPVAASPPTFGPLGDILLMEEHLHQLGCIKHYETL